MKYIYFILLCFSANCLSAQNFEFIEGNNLRCRVVSDGNIAYVYGTTNMIEGFHNIHQPTYETLDLISLAISGIDNNDSIYSASSIFYSSDFRPGPIGIIQNDSLYDKVWLISRAQVDYHLLHYTNPGYIADSCITNWPAHGNIANGESYQLAPFFDVNQDQNYDPLQGDYPLFPGDVCAFTMFNDNNAHAYTGGESLKTEVHSFTYLFLNNSDSALMNSIFVDYTIINRSTKDYYNFSPGLLTCATIGSVHDNAAGIDSTKNLIIYYNADEVDGTISSVDSVTPSLCIRSLNRKISNFLIETNGGPTPAFMTPPDFTIDFFLNQSSIWKSGDSLVNGGCGCSCAGGTAGGYAKLMCPGHPADTASWNYLDCSFSSNLYTISSTEHLTFNAGDSLSLSCAIIYAPDYGGTHITSFNLCRQYSDDVQNYYDSGTLEVEEVEMQHDAIIVYPNPADESIQFTLKDDGKYHYTLTDVAGRICWTGHIEESTTAIDISSLSPGMYFIQFSSEKRSYSGKFIKE